MTKKLITVLLVLFTSASFAFADINMKEGEWEITTKMEMTGMPMQIPPQTNKQCITKQDMLPQNNKPENGDCKVKNMKTSGGTVSWVIECDSPNGKSSGSGKITYSGNTMKGSIKMKVPGNIQMTTKLTGKRIGPCK